MMVLKQARHTRQADPNCPWSFFCNKTGMTLSPASDGWVTLDGSAFELSCISDPHPATTTRRAAGTSSGTWFFKLGTV